MLKKFENIPVKIFLSIIIAFLFILLINSFIINFKLPFSNQACQNAYNILNTLTPFISIIGIFFVIRTLIAMNKQIDAMYQQKEVMSDQVKEMESLKEKNQEINMLLIKYLILFLK